MRLAAIPALVHFPADPPGTAALLRDRLDAETTVLQRLAIVDAGASLGLQFPQTAAEVWGWLDELAAETDRDAAVRLAALAARARVAPADIPPGLVEAAVTLIRATGENPAPAEQWAAPAKKSASAPAPAAPGVPPHITEAFEHLERSTTVYAPTTALLKNLHQALDSRVADRTMLLTAQLAGPDRGTRLEGIRMAGQMMTAWRGDHSTLIYAIARQLAGPAQIAAEAATVLGTCHRIAEPAREALAASVAHEHCDEHDGPRLWTAENARLRRAHQETVLALARLGDVRALPSLLVGLDEDVDAWRAIQAARHLPQCAEQLIPRLRTRLAALDVAGVPEYNDLGAAALLTALTALADPGLAVPAGALLDAATGLEHWSIATAAAHALGHAGPEASAALPTLRTLVACDNWSGRSAALVALWRIAADPQEILDLLRAHLTGPSLFHDDEVTTVLHDLGPAAADLAPLLRDRLHHAYEWTRVYAAENLWAILGAPETDTVIQVLLQAWEQNQMTASHVVSVLDRMGPAAAPALPRLRVEIAHTRRGGRYGAIDTDEDLIAACQMLIDRLG